MNDERWEELLYKIGLKSGPLDVKVDTMDEGRTKIETVVFQTAMGKLKLQRTSKPVVVERKTRYSKRIGGATDEEYVYSETDKSYRVALYRWNEEESAWDEVDVRKVF
jgi:hypothetical protein